MKYMSLKNAVLKVVRSGNSVTIQFYLTKNTPKKSPKGTLTPSKSASHLLVKEDFIQSAYGYDLRREKWVKLLVLT